MRIIISTDDDNFVKLYLMLWKTVLKLTDSEVNTLDVILKSYLSLQTQGLKEEYIPPILFSSKSRKIFQDALGCSQNQFNNTIKTLKDKGILEPVDEFYKIRDRRIIPVDELIFKFQKRESGQTK